MYTDEDLNIAIKDGIFSQNDVNEFRKSISISKESSLPDEENFKLVGGFNDIFVVIACILLLSSSVFVLSPMSESLGYISFILISWVLAEFFVLKRKMSLPAIVLLISFVGGVFSFVSSYTSELEEFYIGAAASTFAAYLHWIRFKVPITIAAGTISLIVLIISSIVSIFPSSLDYILLMAFIFGISAFLFAMYWDSSDTSRTTRKSDVAFWLHLVSAPLIIHPSFSFLGIYSGNDSFFSMFSIIILYVLMTIVSIIIDRRAFMVSSLVYVLYALSSIIETYGGVAYSFALTGVFMGASLLVLSAFWHRVRKYLLSKLPSQIKSYIPKVN